MSATNVLENGLLSLLFQNANYANVGDATGLRGSSAAGVFYVSMHTASPGETGSQNTTESAYTGYGRVSVARDSSHWAVSGGVADNVNAITFGQSSTGPESETYVGIGSDLSGAGNLFLYGAMNATLVVNNLIIPNIAAGALDITLD